jgi:hypothetical protein
MPVAARQSQPPVAAQLAFEAFKPMHRTLDPGLCVVSLEAKGAYCPETAHVAGRLTAIPSAVTSEIEFPDLLED